MSKEIQLKLYVIGDSLRSRRAQEQLHRHMEHRFEGEYEIIVIDIEQDPESAEHDRILVVPTVIKVKPLPRQRIIGSLADEQRVLQALDLTRVTDGEQGVV
jgi:circadian clock protein KaiB